MLRCTGLGVPGRASIWRISAVHRATLPAHVCGARCRRISKFECDRPAESRGARTERYVCLTLGARRLTCAFSRALFRFELLMAICDVPGRSLAVWPVTHSFSPLASAHNAAPAHCTNRTRKHTRTKTCTKTHTRLGGKWD